MNDPLLNDLLSYKNSLTDQKFTAKVLEKIELHNKRRRIIIWCFGILGMLLSLVYLLTMAPASWQNLINPTHGVMFTGIGLFITWLWTVELYNQ
jgi:hypothetical protein